MLNSFTDITDRIATPPEWWDENGVPRFAPFSPELVADIYAREVAFVEIACQACGQPFKVAFSCSGHAMQDVLTLSYGGTPKGLADAAKSGELYYGDPPNIGCCAGGPTMSSEFQKVIRFWQRNKDTDYQWKEVALDATPAGTETKVDISLEDDAKSIPLPQPLDPYTFGGSPAAVSLALILTEIGNPKLVKSVSKFCEAVSGTIKALSDLPPSSARSHLALLLRQTWPIQTERFPRKVASHVCNVLTARLNKSLRETCE